MCQVWVLLLEVKIMSYKAEDWQIVCPQSNEKLVPEKVWKGDRGHTYGTFKKHHHAYKECDYSGLPVKAEPKPRQKVEETIPPPYVILSPSWESGLWAQEIDSCLFPSCD